MRWRLLLSFLNMTKSRLLDTGFFSKSVTVIGEAGFEPGSLTLQTSSHPLFYILFCFCFLFKAHKIAHQYDFLIKLFYFEIIVDSQAVDRNNSKGLQVAFNSVSPSCDVLQNNISTSTLIFNLDSILSRFRTSPSPPKSCCPFRATSTFLLHTPPLRWLREVNPANH